MSFITFFYKINKDDRRYYGKFYTDYFSDDHEGLDEEVRPSLERGLKEYYMQENLSALTEPIQIGVIALGCHEYIPTYSSKREKDCFDFYCEMYRDNKSHLFINGKKVLNF